MTYIPIATHRLTPIPRAKMIANNALRTKNARVKMVREYRRSLSKQRMKVSR